MRILRRHLSTTIAVGLLLSMATCQPPEMPLEHTYPSFIDTKPILMDVRIIQVINRSEPSARKGTSIENDFPLTPTEAIKRWAHQRLRAMDNQLSAPLLEVAIHEASVIQEPLPKSGGIKGTLVKEPIEKLTATLNVELRLYHHHRAMSVGRTRSEVMVTRELLEGATEKQRKAIYADITRELLEKLDTSMIRGIEQYLGKYLHTVMPQ